MLAGYHVLSGVPRHISGLHQLISVQTRHPPLSVGKVVLIFDVYVPSRAARFHVGEMNESGALSLHPRPKGATAHCSGQTYVNKFDRHAGRAWDLASPVGSTVPIAIGRPTGLCL